MLEIDGAEKIGYAELGAENVSYAEMAYFLGEKCVIFTPKMFFGKFGFKRPNFSILCYIYRTFRRILMELDRKVNRIKTF